MKMRTAEAGCDLPGHHIGRKFSLKDKHSIA
jgi:hypothetical protein